MLGPMRRPAAALAFSWLLLLLCAAPAFPDRDTGVLAPLLEVQVLDRELVAIDAEGGGQRTERLERGERVLYTRSQGRVGVAVTDRRLLAVGTRSGAWQQARYRKDEAPPADVELGDRVALVLMATRAVGFDGGSRNLVESTLGPRESVLDTAVGQNVALVVTDRRALGLSSDRGGFFEVRLRSGEKIESVTALANHGTLQTSQRLLTFRGATASWEERRRTLR
ncbi:MAG: hypothetical protein DCC71_05130 [Proteobacteria bacterium]|nr:MAG: hypothetical protein DCC71_05130 [Pseudomonadota bacterium]